jgi:hypothetical protein
MLTVARKAVTRRERQFEDLTSHKGNIPWKVRFLPLYLIGTTMPALYQLSDAIQSALSECSEDGEITPDLEARLNALQIAFEDKVHGICQFMRQCELDATVVSIEVERLTKLKQSLTGKFEWLKGYLQRSMQALGMTAVDTPLFHLRIQRNSRPSFVLAAGAEVPEQFRRVEVSMDGNAVYAAWKEGKDVFPPEITVKQGSHLRIR